MRWNHILDLNFYIAKAFLDVHETVDEELHSGRIRAVQTDENVSKVRYVIKYDCRLQSYWLVMNLNINRQSVHEILTRPANDYFSWMLHLGNDECHIELSLNKCLARKIIPMVTQSFNPLMLTMLVFPVSKNQKAILQQGGRRLTEAWDGGFHIEPSPPVIPSYCFLYR